MRPILTNTIIQKMRKFYLLLVLASLVFASNANAQEVKFGLKGGLTHSSFNGDDLELAYKTGFYIGGFVEKQLSEKFALQGEFLYSEQGAANEEDSDNKIRFNYINIPVICKYYVSDKFNLQFGPQIGFNVLSEVTDGDVTIDFEEATEEEVNSLDFGFNFGAEVFVTDNIGLNARYNIGLREIVKESEVYNSVLQFGLAYRF